MLCTAAGHGQSSKTLQAGGSLNALGIRSPHNSHSFHVIFRERGKSTVELRGLIGQGLIMSVSLSLLLSRDVWPLSELANFVFTNHSVGCREREKKERRRKKKANPDSKT